MNISRTAVAGPLAVALAIPAFAVGQSAPSEEAQPPATAYGVVCQRQGASKVDSDTQPGTEFSRCVSEHRKSVNGQKTPGSAARVTCGETHPGPNFGKCVASTHNLILGLRGLKAQP